LYLETIDATFLGYAHLITSMRRDHCTVYVLINVCGQMSSITILFQLFRSCQPQQFTEKLLQLYLETIDLTTSVVNGTNYTNGCKL
jgi:hypothetical protein